MAGDEIIGLYPLLEDDHCWLLAADFDGPTWRLDALAYLDAAAAQGVPGYLERSRSGQGAHVWMFFTEPVAATDARRLGTGLLRAAIDARAELALDSYDRLFPSQDLTPRGSFGNLIALPMQGRVARDGNSVFLDHDRLAPVEDQWRLLGRVDRISPAQLAAALRGLAPMRTGRDEAAAWRRSARQPKGPARIAVTADARLRVDKSGLSTSMLAAMKHLASVANLEFFAKQRLRLSTWQTPRVIRAYRAELEKLAQRAGSTLDIQSAWPRVEPLDVAFRGVLTAQQQDAVDDLAEHALGVLVSPPGTCKTVMGCALIATAGVPSLVLVYRTPLLEQWRDQLAALLDLDADQIGQLGGGRDRRSGVVDAVEIEQTLARRDDIADLTSRYGLLVVDECHRVPAVTIADVVGQIPVRRVLGLTATPYRQDGLDALIAMHCGPIRHQPGQAATGLGLQLEVHDTRFRFPSSEQIAIQQIFAALAEDPQRTRQIAADVADAVAAGRRCLVLSERKAHLTALANELDEHGVGVLVLHGSLSRADQQRTMDRLETVAERPVAVVATGQYVGEGFDCPPLDTLFITFPISSKGKIVQYVGRVLRPFDGKHTVTVHDYHDAEVPVLRRMLDRRRKATAHLGSSDATTANRSFPSNSELRDTNGERDHAPRSPQHDPNGHLKMSCESLNSLKSTIMVKFMSGTMDALYELAEPQAGYFTTAQATEAGVSNRALYQRARGGDIDHLRYGLYRLRRFPAHPFEDVIAACLWAGDDSAASHETALAVHSISDAMPSAIHITVPRRFRGRQDGVVIHHADLPDADRTRVDAVPVTTIARTLQDVAATSDPALVEQAVAQAVARGTLSRRQLRRLVRDTPRLAPMVVGALAEE